MVAQKEFSTVYAWMRHIYAQQVIGMHWQQFCYYGGQMPVGTAPTAALTIDN